MAAKGEGPPVSRGGGGRKSTTTKNGRVEFSGARLLKRSIAFALLLLLVPLNPPPGPSSSTWTLLSSSSGGDSDDGSSSSGVGPLGPALFRLGQLGLDRTHRRARGNLLVSAIYLEEVGRFSQVMSNFVDSLLDKVGFLAEIVIESSMDEQCEFSLAAAAAAAEDGQPERNSSSSPSLGCFAKNKNNNNDSTKTMPTIQKTIEPRWMNTTIGNVGQDDADLGGLKQTLAADKSAAEARGRQKRQQQRRGEKVCRFLGLPMQNNDLPVAGMAECCAQFEGCYSSCGQQKLACDSEFRACLRSICKQKFDPKNETILREETKRMREARQQQPDDDSMDLLQDEDDDDDSNNGGENIGEPSAGEVKSIKDKYKACRLAGKVLIIGNLAFGCRNYRRHQFEACCLGAVQAVPGKASK